jgi:hypothetical protein
MRFSADGNKVAYLGLSGGEYCRVLNDEILDRVPIVTSGGSFDVVFSPDGRRAAYKVIEGNSQAVIVDRKRGPRFEEVGEPVFSYDSTKVAYAARDDRGSFVVTDGQRGATVASGEIDEIALAPDGRTVAYSVRTRQLDAYVVVSGLGKGPIFDSVASLQFSPDGKQLAYWAAEGKTQFVVLNHKRIGPSFSPESRSFDPIVFSHDGRSIAYRGWRGKKQFYLIAGKEGPAFDEVSDFAYAPNGKDYAYVATDGDYAFIISPVLANGRSGKREAAWSPVFGPNGKSLAYVFGSGYSKEGVMVPGRTKFGVSVNGVDGPMTDSVDFGSLRFSDDGSRLFYGAEIGKELWRKSIAVR